MLEYLIPEGTDTADARRLLTQKGEADLRAQGATLFDTLKRINGECRGRERCRRGDRVRLSEVVRNSPETDADRNAQLMRMTAERKAIRRGTHGAGRQGRDPQRDRDRPARRGQCLHGRRAERATRGDRDHASDLHAVGSPDGRAWSGITSRRCSTRGGSGAGFDPSKGARPFLENHKTFAVPGLTLDAILGAEFGHPRSQMTQGSSGTGYKPFSYRDLREALMTSQINSYTGMLERRSTDGQLKVNYLQETAQTMGATNVGEGAQGGESNFTVAEASVDLRKISTFMQFHRRGDSQPGRFRGVLDHADRAGRGESA